MIQTIIMAGGRGVRLASVSGDKPKPMVSIEGKPAIERQIESLQKNGLKDITIVVGYLGQTIKEYLGNGEKYGVKIDYFFEETPLGTAGSLFALKDSLDKRFLLVNADLIYNFNFGNFIDFHNKNRAIATIAAQETGHPQDSVLISRDLQNRVTGMYFKDKPRPSGLRISNAAIHLLDKEVLDFSPLSKSVDLDRDILQNLIPGKRFFAYLTQEYIEDFGTPQRYAKVCSDIRDNKVKL